MTPAAKFYALVSSGTIAVMFLIVRWVVPMILNFGILSSLASGLVGILSSIGIYKLISLGAEAIIHRSDKARGWIFGGSYLHGTWVGMFIGRAGDKRFIIEHFDQDLDGLVINGQSYTEATDLHGDWTSVSVSLDNRSGRLIFSYTLTIHSRPGTLVGINSSQLERTSHRNPATSIIGHAQDLGDDVRVQIVETKVWEKLLPWGQALQLAQEKYP